MNIFVISFFVLCGLCGSLFYYTHSKIKSTDDPNFARLQFNYVLVYMLAMAGDWLQGPYVYALYEHYGMSKRQIELLFVGGFGSSMIMGTFIGSFGDKIGRKKNCLLYGLLYALSCVTKHFQNFYVLMVGRLLGGIATSLLYSSFESWLLSEHRKYNLPQDLLGTIFSHAYLGNSLVAILSGVLAQYSVDLVGFVAPFDIAIVFLSIMSGIILFLWTENYGDAQGNIGNNFKKSMQTIFTDYKVLSLGAIQSFFEGSMYCFVLEWTPALSIGSDSSDSKVDGHRGKIPHGYIFASFMVAMMIGSCAFKVLERRSKIESFMRIVLGLSTVCIAMPWLLPHDMVHRQMLLFIAFILFEISIGIFWPALGTLRGRYVPEEIRATVMNCFRVPLNFIVIVILCQNFSITFVFQLCTIFLTLSVIFQELLYRLSLKVEDTPIQVEESIKDDV